MDSSNSSKSSDFRMRDLLISQFPEDWALARQAEAVMAELIKELKPILRYVAVPVPVMETVITTRCEDPNIHIVNPYSGYRSVNLTEDREIPGAGTKTLFLKEDGTFFVATKCPAKSQPMHFHFNRDEKNPNGYTWQEFSFEKLITALKGCLQEATEKRQQHLSALSQRSAMLDKILEVIKQAATTTT